MGPGLRPQGCTRFGNRLSRSSILLDPELCETWWDEELGAAGAPLRRDRSGRITRYTKAQPTTLLPRAGN
eukprot:scaffold37371_cov30-Phaeocystis_antarctica.AAC.1